MEAAVWLSHKSLMTSGARLFVIVGNLTASEAIEVFLDHRQQIELLARSEQTAFIAKVRRDGVHIWQRFRDWERAN